MRESIKNFFADLDCFTLVRPVTNEQSLAHIEDLNYSTDLRPEFVQSMDALISKLKQPKEVHENHLRHYAVDRLPLGNLGSDDSTSPLEVGIKAINFTKEKFD